MDYESEFTMWALRTDWSFAELFNKLKDGLNNNYAEILAKDASMGTWTLEQWKSKACALEDNAEIMNMRTNLPRTGRSDWSKPPHTMNFKKDPNAMEVDAIKFPPRPVFKNNTNRPLPGNTVRGAITAAPYPLARDAAMPETQTCRCRG